MDQPASSEAVDEQSKNKDTEWIESSQSEAEEEKPAEVDGKSNPKLDASQEIELRRLKDEKDNALEGL